MTDKYAGAMSDGFFKTLTADEEKEYRTWACENHRPGGDVNGCWHPIVRDECRKIDAAHGLASE
jgi:hypothetical protein